ncbi:MAG: Fic family protein [Nanoarchaeota archaeon]|nr:Fic family protein [Nanoarchaeota archaeon]
MNQISYIHPYLISQINKKKNLLEKAEHQKKLFKMFRIYEEAAQVEAIRHSLWMEKQDEDPAVHYNPNRKENQKAIKNSFNALLWAQNNLKIGGTNKEHISIISGMLDPEWWQKYAENAPSNPKYRSMAVRPGGADGPHTPPYPAEVPDEMRRYFEKLNSLLIEAEEERGEKKKCKKYDKALAAAGYAHFHLLRIHPFEDTNGRTSRTLQNAILKYFGLPPAIIFGGEKSDYISHLISAKNGYGDRFHSPDIDVSGGEFNFYNYIAGKVNTNLDRILGKEIPLEKKGLFGF